jgi:hypothetical protein
MGVDDLHQGVQIQRRRRRSSEGGGGGRRRRKAGGRRRGREENRRQRREEGGRGPQPPGAGGRARARVGLVDGELWGRLPAVGHLDLDVGEEAELFQDRVALLGDLERKGMYKGRGREGPGAAV